ncbi:MAG: M15 family metallopeptidase [Rubrivivax sp.]
MPTVAIDALPHDAEFRALATLRGVAVDLRYAGARNLLGRDLYHPHDCAFLHVQAADALQRAADWLARERPDLRLCVLDAVRPQRVQELFWAHVQGTPMQPYFAPPERGSIHSFGMAVDLTLVDAEGRERDMGTPFDDTTELSHPALEAAHAAAGRLAEQALAHRRLLRTAMRHGGWQGIATEWWHFDCGERDAVRRHWRRIV